MTPRHKVFISFHHGNDDLPGDQLQQRQLENDCAGTSFISRSVGMGDIDPNLPPDTIRQKIRQDHLEDSTVTIVLVGKHTWKRKHVDWEIGSSIRHTKNNPRSGLVGLILPTHPYYKAARQEGRALGDYSSALGVCYYQTIPPRLYDNIQRGYAECYFWPGDGRGAYTTMEDLIHNAYERRFKDPAPDNSYPSFDKNKNNSAPGW